VLTLAACASGADTTRQVAAVKKPPRTTLAPTTSTTSAPVQYASAPVGVKRVRVSVLPGERPARPVKQQASYRGPAPTGRIIIPRIGLNHLTYEGIELSTIDYGPSHWPGTANPGQTGNAVFPGHRVTHSHPFYDIDLIQVGDAVTFETAEGRFTYEVTDTFVVDDEETWIADPTDTPTMTIFGCHPKHSAQQRYVVKGKLVQSQKAYSSQPPPNDGHTAPGDNNNYEPPPEPTTTTTQPKSLIPRIGG
jgi:sortase A